MTVTAPLTTPATATVGRARSTIVATALTLGSAAVAAVVLWRPVPRDTLDYAGLAPLRGEAWASYLIDSIGFMVAAVALSIAVCLLAPARGAGWANAGAILTSVGGMVFSAAVFAFAMLAWYGTAVPAESGGPVLAALKDDGGHLMGPQVIGFLAYNVGTVLLATALWRARSVPRWLPIALAVLTVAQFPLPDRLIDVAQALLMAGYVAVAWFVMRARR
jgi:hypothetical protein